MVISGFVSTNPETRGGSMRKERKRLTQKSEEAGAEAAENFEMD
jgi:hypothetical protein